MYFINRTLSFHHLRCKGVGGAAPYCLLLLYYIYMILFCTVTHLNLLRTHPVRGEYYLSERLGGNIFGSKEKKVFMGFKRVMFNIPDVSSIRSTL